MNVYIAKENTAGQADTLSQLRTDWLSLSPATIELDRNFCIRDWSQGAEAILGFRARDVVGQNLDLVVNQADIEPVRDMWEDLLELGKTVTCCIPCIDKFGEIVSCEGEFCVETIAGEEICFLILSDLDFTSPEANSLESLLSELDKQQSPWLIY